MPTESGGTKSRSGGMSVSLAGPDGRVLGGGLAGLLVAAGPVQVENFFFLMKPFINFYVTFYTFFESYSQVQDLNSKMLKGNIKQTLYADCNYYMPL